MSGGRQKYDEKGVPSCPCWPPSAADRYRQAKLVLEEKLESGRSWDRPWRKNIGLKEILANPRAPEEGEACLWRWWGADDLINRVFLRKVTTANAHTPNMILRTKVSNLPAGCFFFFPVLSWLNKCCWFNTRTHMHNVILVL